MMPLPKSLLPRCFACLRRATMIESTLQPSLFGQQVRGKKKKARLPPTINVKLLRDIRGYGREGAIVPVAPGRMRNIWYPARRAAYMTIAETIANKKVMVERDFTFGMEMTEVEKAEVEKADPLSAQQVDAEPLSAQRTTELLSDLVPQVITFFRQPIPSKDVTDSKNTQASTEAIYGSVSSLDIATCIKSILSELAEEQQEDAARVVLGPEDISIVASKLTDGRIKSLGDFEVEIRSKNGDIIKRVIRVQSEHAASV